MAIESALAAASALGIAGACGAWREGRTRRSARRGILAPCLDLFDEVETTLAPDGYPKLKGRIGGREVRLSLVHDTLALRRLPQLWLSVVVRTATRFPTLVVTARPRCEDFVGWRSGAVPQMHVPQWLPMDMRLCGDTDGRHLLDTLREPLFQAFADPLLKEVAFAGSGVEILYRLSEGRRGAHLLLRQAAFEAELKPALVVRLLALVAQCDLRATPRL